LVFEWINELNMIKCKNLLLFFLNCQYFKYYKFYTFKLYHNKELDNSRLISTKINQNQIYFLLFLLNFYFFNSMFGGGFPFGGFGGGNMRDD